MKKTTNTKAAIDEAKAKIADGRKQMNAVNASRAKLGARGDTSDLQLEEAEAKAKISRGEAELAAANRERRDSLLAAEVKAGDADAKALAGLDGDLDRIAVDVIKLEKAIALKRAEARQIASAAGGAFDRLVARRLSASEPAPRRPMPMIFEARLALRQHAHEGPEVSELAVARAIGSSGEADGRLSTKHLPVEWSPVRRVTAILSGESADILAATAAETRARLDEESVEEIRKDISDIRAKRKEAEARAKKDWESSFEGQAQKKREAAREADREASEARATEHQAKRARDAEEWERFAGAPAR